MHALTGQLHNIFFIIILSVLLSIAVCGYLNVLDPKRSHVCQILWGASCHSVVILKSLLALLMPQLAYSPLQ